MSRPESVRAVAVVDASVTVEVLDVVLGLLVFAKHVHERLGTRDPSMHPHDAAEVVGLHDLLTKIVWEKLSPLRLEVAARAESMQHAIVLAAEDALAARDVPSFLELLARRDRTS